MSIIHHIEQLKQKKDIMRQVSKEWGKIPWQVEQGKWDKWLNKWQGQLSNWQPANKSQDPTLPNKVA